MSENNNKSNHQKENKNKKKNQPLSQVEIKEAKEIAAQSEKAIELVMYNKINAKNAFDINVEFLEHITNLLNKNEETSWQKASASLDASAKIYGYRVDSVHSETFKFLGGLSRDKNNNEEEAGDGVSEENLEKKRQKNKQNLNGIQTLEKDPKKLLIGKFDLEFDVDPLFKLMTARFNETGAKALLLNNLLLDDKLDLLLETKESAEDQNSTEVTCISKGSVDKFNGFTEENKKIIDEFVSNMTIDELVNLEIAPDLAIFKKNQNLDFVTLNTTQLDNTMNKSFINNSNNKNNFKNNNLNIGSNFNENDKSFYHNLVNELDNEEIINANNIVNIDDELEQGDIVPQDLSQQLSDNIEINSSNISQNFDELNSINENPSDQIVENNFVNNNFSFVGDGFSLFKHDDIILHENQFGDGSRNVLKSLPQFQNFIKGFSNLDKNQFWNKKKMGLLANNNEEKKAKKEEKLFDFSIENEVKRSDIFTKETKQKKILDNISNSNYKKERKKVKQFYNFDKYDLFKMFSIPERTYFYHNNIDDEMINGEGQQNFEDNDGFADSGENNNMGDQTALKADNTFIRFDKEYEKKYGQLYKRFDVRNLKKNLWDSYEVIEESRQDQDKVNFKDVVKNMSQKLDQDTLGNISTSTCFVCFLHLCNEKELKLSQSDDQCFYIENDKIN